MEADPADLPPELGWEAPVWELFEAISTQWRMGFAGPYGLDYNPAIALMQERGWRLALGLDLLKTVETSWLAAMPRKET
jgi:hypothetical protein